MIQGQVAMAEQARRQRVRRPLVREWRDECRCGTLLLTPGSHIAACDANALSLLGWNAGDLLSRPIRSVLPDLPMVEHLPSENIRYTNQNGGLCFWKPCRGRTADGRPLDLEVLLSRCGFRPGAAICLYLRAARNVARNRFLWPQLARHARLEQAACIVAVHP
jgi:hypothetical protein